jgi:hypothetical protein
MYRCRADFIYFLFIVIYGFNVICFVYGTYSLPSSRPQEVKNSKKADLTLLQACLQYVLPTKDDVSTVNDTCPENKQFSCTVKRKELTGNSSWPALRRIAWRA